MADSENTGAAGVQKERRLAEHLKGNVRFTVPGIGDFIGRRLTALEVLDAHCDQALLLEEALVRLIQRRGDVAKGMTVDMLPVTTQNNAYYVAMLEAADVMPAANADPEKLWGTARELDGDLVQLVYRLYALAKAEAFRTDDEAVGDLKE